MKLTEPFTKTGEFFIEGEGYRGSFSYDPFKGLFLILKDLPFKYDHQGFSILTGIVDGEPYSCTLLNLFPQESMFSGNRDGLTRTSTFSVEAVLGDKQITDEKELVFNKIRFAYSNFREWLNKPTVFATLNYDDEKDDSILLKKFPDITGSLNDSFDFEIEIRNTGSYGNTTGDFDISLEQYVTFGLVSKDGKLFPIGEYLKMNKIIKNFFMFLQGRYVVEESIFCHKEKEEPFPDDILPLILFSRRFKQAKKLGVGEKFSYQYNPFIFERILQNWVKKYEEMPDFFDKFFENCIKENLSPINKFENLYQSLMFYYNYNFEKTRMSDEDYTSFFNNLLNKLEGNEKEFVERFRVQGNNISARMQLGKIFEQLEYLKDKKNREPYVNDVVDVRNRIQHATENIGRDLLQDSSNMAHNLNSFTSSLILYEIEYEK